MKLKLFFLLHFVITINSFGQISFEKGYFIDNENNRIECYIKNYDWNLNPTEIEYKLLESDNSKKISIDETKEFGIIDFSRYIRVEVKIDMSSMDITSLSNSRNPEWIQKRIFLKELVHGKASLYKYSESIITRYFYSINDSSIQQLVYKEYMIKGGYQEGEKIATNNTFQQQLFNDVNCNNKSINQIKSISYKQGELEKLFIKYNECNGGELNKKVNSTNREYLNFKITPGYTNSSILLSHTTTEYIAQFNLLSNPKTEVITFNSINSIRLGIETEVFLPFKKNKWSVVFEPIYQSWNSQASSSEGDFKIYYKAIDLSMGARYYSYLKNDFTFIINAFTNLNVTDFDSRIELHQAYKSDALISTLPINTRINLGFGCGFGYKRFNAEIRYYIDKSLFASSTWTSNYDYFSVIIGYKFLKFKTK